jgi:hypothetical protein
MPHEYFDSTTTGKTAERAAYWRERIGEQERSGVSVQQFCKEKSITEQSFYIWRKRLRKQEPTRFALVETGPAQHAPKTELELVLVTGERTHLGGFHRVISSLTPYYRTLGIAYLRRG